MPDIDNSLEKKRIYLLILIFISITIISVSLTIFWMYKTALEENKLRLMEIAQSQARHIETVNRFDEISFSVQNRSKKEAWEYSLDQFKEAHKKYKGFGKTGEFTLAQKIDNKIVFLLSHRHSDLKNPKPVPFNSKLAAPMRNALNNKSGTIIGLDYRGELVVAAHEPVYTDIANFGIVAKIDLSEIRQPFINTGIAVLFLVIIAVIFGSFLFFRITDPILLKQKRIQEESKQRDEMLTSVFNVIPDLLFIMKADGTIIDFRSQSNNQLYLSPEDFIGKKMQEVLPNDVGEKFKENLDKIFEKDNLSIFEYELKINNNTEFYEARMAPLPLNQYVMVIVRNITKRKLSEKELFDKEHFISAIADTTPALIYVVDLQTYSNIYSNNGVTNILGYTPKEIQEMGEDLFPNLIHPDDLQRVYDFQSLISNSADNEILTIDYRLKHKNGTWKYFHSIEKVFIRDKNNQAKEKIGIAFDVSDIKKIEEDLRRQDKIMIAQSRQVAMGEMVAMIAHQWRQPITTVTMVANNILLSLRFDEKIENAMLKEDMEKIVEQTQYVSDTIDDFRNFFNPNKEKEISSVSKVMKDTLNIIGKSFENNNIEIILNNIKSIELELFTKELMQVFLNILNNSKDAIKAKDTNDGKVTIEINIEDNNQIIKISDNGIGIDKKVIDRLGEPYLTTKLSQGTGLGLYMSKIIINKHLLGSLSWKNIEQGAQVEISLPLEKKDK